MCQQIPREDMIKSTLNLVIMSIYVEFYTHNSWVNRTQHEDWIMLCYPMIKWPPLDSQKVLSKMIPKLLSCLLGDNWDFLCRTNHQTMFGECWYACSLYIYIYKICNLVKDKREKGKGRPRATTKPHKVIRKIPLIARPRVHKRTIPYITFLPTCPPHGTWHPNCSFPKWVPHRMLTSRFQHTQLKVVEP